MNLDINDLEEGCTLLEGLVVLKCLDEEGNLFIQYDHTGGLTAWEALGMAITASDRLRTELANAIEVDGAEES